MPVVDWINGANDHERTMLVNTPVTIKLSDQPIYAVKALQLGPHQFLFAAAGEKLWLFVVTLANADCPQLSRKAAPNLDWELLTEWQPVDPPADSASEADDSTPSTRRSDLSGCPFHTGYLDPPRLTPAAAGPGRCPGQESLYTLCLITLPSTYAGPLGLPGHTLCVTGGQAGYLHVFNVHLRQHVRVVRAGLGGDINDLVPYPLCPYWVVVACKDRTVRVVDLHLGQSMLTLGGIAGHQGQVLCVDVHASGKWVVSGGADCVVRLWRVPDGVGHGAEVRVDTCVKWTQWPHANFVDGVAFLGDDGAPDGDGLTVMSKSVDGQVVVWQMQTRHDPGDDAGNDESIQEDVVTGRPKWATHRGLNADVEERGPRPNILGILKYPAHDLWFFKLSFTFPYLSLGTGACSMVAWHLPRTLRILRDRVRASSIYMSNLSAPNHRKRRRPMYSDNDDDGGDGGDSQHDVDAYLPAVRTLPSIVTPTADYMDRYKTCYRKLGAGPIVWTRKQTKTTGDLIRMCVAVPFESADEEQVTSQEAVAPSCQVRFAREAEEARSEDEGDEEDQDEESGGGVLLLFAGVSEKGRLLIGVTWDQAPPIPTDR